MTESKEILLTMIGFFEAEIIKSKVNIMKDIIDYGDVIGFKLESHLADDRLAVLISTKKMLKKQLEDFYVN